MKTVYVGLSGGVDSAVSAHLLKKAGYRVVGAFIKVWEPDWLPCTSREDQLSAMRVAAHLEIPFVTYDFAEEYKRDVVDYFVGEYKVGRTPNPDVMCNRAIKFGALWERAHKDGADFIATGHYAQNKNNHLYRGVDPTKDQAYFLWMLTEDDLTHVLFPIGHLQKSEVRKIAKEARLPNATRRDSQGLCFLGHVDMKEFLMHELNTTRDDPRLYTVGEKLHGEYVIDKKPTNILNLESVQWVNDAPKESETYEAEVRYHGDRYPVSVVGTAVHFHDPVLAASGQSFVIYDPKTGECKGGGIIT